MSVVTAAGDTGGSFHQLDQLVPSLTVDVVRHHDHEQEQLVTQQQLVGVQTSAGPQPLQLVQTSVGAEAMDAQQQPQGSSEVERSCVICMEELPASQVRSNLPYFFVPLSICPFFVSSASTTHANVACAAPAWIAPSSTTRATRTCPGARSGVQCAGRTQNQTRSSSHRIR